MRPTLSSGDPVWVVSGYYRVNSVRRGDLVAIRFATRDVPMVKRVVAVSGDEVAIRKGKLHVGKSTYPLPGRATAVLAKQLAHNGGIVPNGNLIAMGDNPSASMDSAMFGVISTRKLLGRVFLSPPPARTENCGACHRSSN